MSIPQQPTSAFKSEIPTLPHPLIAPQVRNAYSPLLSPTPCTLCSISSSESTGRSVLRPEGSPTRPVAPPSSATGRCPHLCQQQVTDIKRRENQRGEIESAPEMVGNKRCEARKSISTVSNSLYMPAQLNNAMVMIRKGGDAGI